MKVSFVSSGYMSMPTIAAAAVKFFDLLDTSVSFGTAETTNQGNTNNVKPESGHFVKPVVALEKLKLSLVSTVGGISLIHVHVPFKQNFSSEISSLESTKRNSIPLFTALVQTATKMASHAREVRLELQARQFIACSSLPSYNTRTAVICKLTENSSAYVQKTFADTVHPKIVKAFKENVKAAFSEAA